MNGRTRTIRVVLSISDQFSKLPGYEVVAAVNSGEELIRVLEKESVDLVITDLVMQGEEDVELNGLRLVSKLRRSHPDIPLVVVTMMTSGGMFHELGKLGVAAIVSKEEPASELAQISMRALIGKEMIVSPKIQMRLAREGSTTKDLAREQPRFRHANSRWPGCLRKACR